jgi:hypothetical protein
MDNGLSNKLAAQASAGEDELVAVTIKSCKNEYGGRSDDVSDNVRRELDEAGVDSDPTIRITINEELD